MISHDSDVFFGGVEICWVTHPWDHHAPPHSLCWREGWQPVGQLTPMLEMVVAPRDVEVVPMVCMPR